MDQVLALAKTSLLAIQIFMDGVCFSTCRYELMGQQGYWVAKHQACACVSYVKPEDSVTALKLHPRIRTDEPRTDQFE